MSRLHRSLSLSSSRSSKRDHEDSSLPHAVARLFNSDHEPDPDPDPSSPFLSSAVLLRALDHVRPPVALRLFRWAHLHLPAPLDPRLASKTLHVLLRSRDLALASSFLSSPSTPPLPNHSYNALLRSLAASGHLRSAISLFNSIPSPSTFSFNSLLAALLRRGRTRDAYQLFEEMLRSPHAPPDVCTFNTLIRGFCLNSMVDEAFRLFRDMPRRGCEPDVVTYNTLIDGLCRMGKVRIAHNLLDGMRRKSSHLVPNVVSYTTVIRGYCGKLLVDEAVGLFKEMGAVGLEPSNITYNTLIQGLCKAQRMDLVKRILEKGDGGGSGDVSFRPDTCTFNTLIAAHCKLGKIDDALQVFNRMTELHVKRDSASYSTMIHGLCDNGDLQRAEELVDELLEKEVLKRRGGCTPLVVAYNLIFEYLCQNGKTEKARILLRQLLDRRAKVDFTAFKTVVLGHCKEGAFEEGYEMVVSMVKRDLMPDAETYIILIEGFLQKEKMDFAWKSLEKMLNSGHRPSTSTFYSVLSGLLKKDRCAEEASNLVTMMLERKIRPNIELSTDVITGLFRNGLNDRAYVIIRSLYDNGYYVKMEKLVEYLCQEHKFLEAQKLLLSSLEKCQNLDSALFCHVINGLCLSRRALEAFMLFYEMVDKGSATAPSECLVALRHTLEEAGSLREADFVAKRIRRANSRN
ncbi:pentatricopeptide repeat-containing protein At1g02060, chloroplastic [Typha angustifolia]|uniref:pentatricopeptide repeat-containing protein At1g02060, chloroplastic n=1 Tax=Typha angustifolia TaxID=59011 RepID=UPI003C30AC2E